MKKRFTRILAAFALLAFMTPSMVGWGQTVSVNDVLWTEPFGGNPSSGTQFSETTSWGDYINPTTFVATDVSSLSYTSSYAMANGGTATNMVEAHVWLNKSVDSYIQISGIKLYNTTKVKISWAQATSGSSTTVYYQFDGTGDFTALSTCSGPNANFESSELSVANHTTITLKFFHPSNNAKNTRIDNLTLTATEVSGGTPTCATPTFNPNGGNFVNNQEVNITCATDGATIYYTLDGSTPTITSTQYTAPFTINATTTVKAFAVKADHDPSEVATAVFTKTTPMTVAEALAATPQDDVYVSGIISDITEVSISYKNATYKISDDGTHSGEMIVFRGRYLNNTDFTSTDQIQVGDQVVVTGDLSDYQGTNQLAQGNYLVSLTRPATIVIPAEALALPCTANDNGSFAVSYTNNFVAADAEANLYTDAACNEAFQDDWIILDDMSTPYDAIPYVLEANPTTTSRTVYMKVTAMDSESNILEKVFTITQAGQPTYTVTYVPNGGSGTMNDPDSPYIAGDNVELLTNTFTAPEGMVWDSWAVTDAENNEVTVEGGMFEMPASNVTVTAQWVADPNATQYEWVLTDLADLTSTDIFVIVGTRDNESYYGMSNDKGTSTQPSAVAVTIANNKLSSVPGDNIKWNVSGDNTNGYVFYPNGSTTTWLYCNTTASSSSNTNMRVGTGDRKMFVLDDYNYLVTNDDYTDRYVSLNGSTDWRGYVNTNQATEISFYKRQVASTNPAVYTSVSSIDLAYYQTSGSFTYDLENTASEYTMNVTVNSEAQSWLSATINTATSTVTITAAVNDGEQRQGIVTVNYLEGEIIKAYEQVTVTQAEFVIDYATLPFAFDGGRADIETTTGLSQENLDSDYASSPKLKFKDTGTWVILKLNEAPTSLSYDIKGNSFSGGTFNVLTSADGETYQTLATYTELGATQSITHINLASTVRYIKWVYSNKSNGNVALGNIHASADYDIYGDVTVAELTIPADKVCTVYSPATLNVTTSLTNSATSSAWEHLIIKDGAQLKTPNTVNGTVEKDITGYSSYTGSGNGGYYLLATPATMDACNETGMWPDAIAEHAGIDFYSFDQNSDDEWRNYKYGNDHFAGPLAMEQGIGYLYANPNDVTLTLQTRGYLAPPTYNYEDHPFIATNENKNVDVTFINGKDFAGYNLIGNPFTCTAYLADGHDFYRMNAAGDGLIINTDAEGGGNAINVCEGIFVVCAANGTVTFTTTDPSDASAGNNNGMVNISVAQVVNSRGAQPSADYARIRINNGENLKKFVFNENTSRIYIPQAGKDYAVVRSAAEAEMPVSFRASENGTYTLAVEAENVEMNYLHLIDNLTGMDVDLLQTPSYTFDAKTSDYASRFRLVFKANGTNENNAETFAYFNGTNWTVSNVGDATLQVVDVTGRTVANQLINGNAELNLNQPAGVYVIRLVNGDNVKTQKVVVR